MTIIEGDLQRAIAKLGDRLVALHIHDNDVKDDLHIAPYICGIVIWERFFRGLKEIDYN